MPVQRLAADLIVVNARIRTLDPSNSIVRALAVKGDRIVGLGSDHDIRSLADDRTEVVDAAGRTVLPAFHDAHTHTHGAALSAAYMIDWGDMAGLRTLADALEVVRRRAANLPPGTWIQGSQFKEDRLAEKRYPTRWELDSVAPDHPVILSSTGNHILMANSLALHAAGITRATEDPPGGKIDRDERGEPSGILRERGKLRLDPRARDSVVPRFTLEQRIAALKAMHQHFLANGVASYQDIVLEPDEIRAYQRMRREGELAVRVQFLIRGVESQTPLENAIELGLETGLGDEWVSLGGIKMSIDGGSLQKNAALYEPYPGEPDNYGIVRIDQQELDEKVLACHQAGLRVAVHAIGPRALDMALQAYRTALEAYPRTDHRHRIEHCGNLPLPWDRFDRVRDLGLLAVPQPGFIPMYGDKWLDIFGEQGMRHSFPFRTMLERGLQVVSSTDFAMVPINPMVSLRACVTRLTRSGYVMGPDERLSVDQALRLLIQAPAYCAFQERQKGSLELGKLADLVILSEDLHEIPGPELERVKVDMTVVGGKVAWASS